MHWLDLFNSLDDELSPEEALQNELEFLELSIPAMLLTIRKNAGLTQAELAKRMGCQEPHVSKLERRSSGLPQLKTIVRYLNAAGARLTIGARHGERVHDVSFKNIAEMKAESGRTSGHTTVFSVEVKESARSAEVTARKVQDDWDPNVTNNDLEWVSVGQRGPKGMTNSTLTNKKEALVSPFQINAVRIPLLEFYGEAFERLQGSENSIRWTMAAISTPQANDKEYLYAEFRFEIEATSSDAPTTDDAERIARAVTVGKFRYRIDDRTLDVARDEFFRALHLSGTTHLYSNLRPFIRTVSLTAGYRELTLPAVDLDATFSDAAYDPDRWVFPEV